MFNKLIATVILVFAIPAMASAWTLTTRATSAGGTISSVTKSGQRSTDGPLSKTGLTAPTTVSFAADSGKVVSRIAKIVNYGVPVDLYNGFARDPKTGASVPTGIPAPASASISYDTDINDDVSIEVTFRDGTVAAENKATATVNNGGTVNGTAGSASVTYIKDGAGKLAEPVVFKFTPSLGGKVVTIIENNGFVLDPAWFTPTTFTNVAGAKVNRVVTVTIPVGTLLPANFTLSATFTGNVAIIAYAGPQQSIVVPDVSTLSPASITLSGSSRGAAGAFTRWSSVSRPAGAAFIPTTTAGAATSATRSVNVTTYGTYVFQYRIADPVAGQQTASVVSVTVAQDPLSAVSKCVTCHNSVGIGAGVYDKWVVSKHVKPSTPAIPAIPVLCASCHNGVDSGGHPGTFSQVAACNPCHNNGEPINHPVQVGTNPCITCHDPHSLVSSGGCNICHGYPPSALTVALSGHVGTHTSATSCASCHGTGAGTNGNHRNGTVDVVITKADGAPHFNNITSGMYPASYITLKQDCSSCHAAGSSNQAIRQQWGATGHADTAAPAWTTYDFKTRSECVRCHTTTGFIAYSTARVTAAWGTSADKTKEVLTCVGCHSDVAAGTVRTVTPNKPFADEGGYTNHNVGVSNICMACHSGSNNGASILVKVGTADFSNLSYVAPHYLTAGGSLQSKSGYHFPGRTYADYSSNSHRKVGMVNNNATGTDGPCVACHMSAPEKHTFSPVTIDATTKAITTITTNVCISCHKTTLPAGTLDARRVEFNNALDILKAQLQSKGFTYSPTYPYFAAKNWGSGQNGANVMGAAFNYKLFASEPGAYTHNPVYAKQLIVDSIDAVFNNGTVTGNIGPALNDLYGKGLITAEQIAAMNNYKNPESSCTSCHGNPPATLAHTAVSAGTCTNCHIYTGPGGDTHNNGVVNVSQTCNGCHGFPPATIAGGAAHSTNTDCATCHGVNAGANSSHRNGSVDTTCVACHGNPPTAQIIHTSGAVKYTHSKQNVVYTDCTGCHETPATSTATLTHRDGTVGLKTNANACASCHSYPPASGAHASASTGIGGTAPNCSTCHSYTVYNAAIHNNGTINLDNVACDTCHGYPPLSAAQLSARVAGTYVNGRVENYAGGGGHHATHLLPTVTPAEGFTPCLPCHPSAYHAQGGGTVTRANVNVNDAADLTFRFDESRSKRYNTATMSCSNVSCHYQPTAAW